jgi:hypothetical protein
VADGYLAELVKEHQAEVAAWARAQAKPATN